MGSAPTKATIFGRPKSTGIEYGKTLPISSTKSSATNPNPQTLNYPLPPIIQTLPSNPQFDTQDSSLVLPSATIPNQKKVIVSCKTIGDEITRRLAISTILKLEPGGSKNLNVSYCHSGITQIFELKSNCSKRAFKHLNGGVVTCLGLGNIFFYMYENGRVSMFHNDIMSSVEMAPHDSSYVAHQIDVLSEDDQMKKRVKVTKEIGYSRLAKVYNGNLIVYKTKGGLALYDCDQLQLAHKKGIQPEVVLVCVDGEIQAVDFLAKTFEQDRICLLTADGRLLKYSVKGPNAVLKRVSLIPDVIDPDISFTEMITIKDELVAAGYNPLTRTNSLVLMSRSFEVQSRLVLEEQSRMNLSQHLTSTL